MDKLSESSKSQPVFVAGYRERRRVIHQAATRSLSEQEKANVAERQARQEAAQADREAKKAASKLSATQGTSRAAKPPVSTSRNRQPGTTVSGSAESSASGLPG